MELVVSLGELQPRLNDSSLLHLALLETLLQLRDVGLKVLLLPGPLVDVSLIGQLVSCLRQLSLLVVLRLRLK